MISSTGISSTGNLGDLGDRSRDADKIALIDATNLESPLTLSRGEVDRRADAVARGLVALGRSTGERIAILAENSADYLIAYFGTMRAGMVSVPVNWRFPPEIIAGILEDCGASLVFLDARFGDAAPANLERITFGAEFEVFLDFGDFEIFRPEPEDLAMFLYTSGSTGRPKGVRLTHDSHLWVIEQRLTPDITDHRLLVAAPLYHMNGLAISKLAYAGHGCEVILPRFEEDAYIEAAARFRCTWLTSVPTMMARVVQRRDLIAARDLSAVSVVRMGSAPATQNLFDNVRACFPGAKVTYGYGTTEAGPVVFAAHPDGLPIPDLALGYPAEGVRLRLIDGADRDDGQGELEMDCPAKMAGYHGLPEKTAEVMTEDGYYRTGDVMRRDADGFHYFVDRVDDMFNCNGENVFPAEVERVLETHPQIAQACVVSVPDEVRGAMPVAFVVADSGEGLDEETVREHALANGPAFQHPRRVWMLDELPLASTGKTDRERLAAAARDRMSG